MGLHGPVCAKGEFSCVPFVFLLLGDVLGHRIQLQHIAVKCVKAVHIFRTEADVMKGEFHGNASGLYNLQGACNQTGPQDLASLDAGR